MFAEADVTTKAGKLNHSLLVYANVRSYEYLIFHLFHSHLKNYKK